MAGKTVAERVAETMAANGMEKEREDMATETTETKTTETKTEKTAWDAPREGVMRKYLERVATGSKGTLWREVGKDYLYLWNADSTTAIFSKVRKEQERECYLDPTWTEKADTWEPPMTAKEKREAEALAAQKAAEQKVERMREAMMAKGFSAEEVDELLA